jgi:SAM-dependent methyltransferase
MADKLKKVALRRIEKHNRLLARNKKLEAKLRARDDSELGLRVKVLLQSLASSEFRDVLSDLVAFTGFPKDEVCFRVAKKFVQDYGARGWFNEEFDFFAPKTAAEYDWFYRAGQSYVFSNSRKRWWGLIDKLALSNQPILDYGAGIGQNVLELFHRGYTDVWYHEIGCLQREFFKFRMRRHGFEPKVIEPYFDGKFDPIGCVRMELGAVILQDVLEHVHDYPRVLKHLYKCLRPGGIIIEHSPFADVQKKVGVYPHMHLEDKVGLKKLALSIGLKPMQIMPVGPKSKSEIRIWKKE